MAGFIQAIFFTSVESNSCCRTQQLSSLSSYLIRFVEMIRFTNFQRLMWKSLTYFFVCRFYIEEDKNGKCVIKKAGKFRLFCYYAMWVNSFIKILYLLLTYWGYLIEVHFLDQMSCWDWFLCFSQLIQETNMWYRKYPLFEVLHANWKMQEDVFRKLGSPNHLQQKILANDRGLVVLHVVIVLVGLVSLAVQVVSVPKYALNTYAVVPYHNHLLSMFFLAHEVLYILHIWVHQASSIVLCEVFAVTYTHIIREMTRVLEQLIYRGELRHARRNRNYSKINSKVPADTTKVSRLRDVDLNKEKIKVGTVRFLDPNKKVPGTEYDIKTLLEDYKKLMFAANEFNSWVGFCQGGTMVSNYGQFVSDVFMLIQLLKEKETDLMAVFFFMEDASAGMIILFRMLILISRLYPASEKFLRVFKLYLTHDVPDKKYLKKYGRTLKIIAAKLGGYKTRGVTVPKGINALMNYYIGAALWKRPIDRIT